MPGNKTFPSLNELSEMTFKAWFPYGRPDRPSRLKKCSDDRDDHMETIANDPDD